MTSRSVSQNRPAHHHTDMILCIDRDPLQEERFWDRVDKSAGPDGCWMWTLSGDKNGYGQFTWTFCDGSRKNMRGHKIAHLLSGGLLTPDKPWVLHKCNVPRCCNPSHLKSGTPKENMADKVAAGNAFNVPRGDNHRSRLHPELLQRGANHWMKRHPEKIRRGDNHWSKHNNAVAPRGVDHHGAKLTDDDIRKIRQMGEDGTGTQRSVAAKFGIRPSTACNIMKRKTWKHVA